MFFLYCSIFLCFQINNLATCEISFSFNIKYFICYFVVLFHQRRVWTTINIFFFFLFREIDTTFFFHIWSYQFRALHTKTHSHTITHTRKHQHTHICVCVCLCVCTFLPRGSRFCSWTAFNQLLWLHLFYFITTTILFRFLTQKWNFS